MRPHYVNKYVNLFGRTGTGKTTYMETLYYRTLQRGGSATLIDNAGSLAYMAGAGTAAHRAGVVTTVEGWLSLVMSARREGRPFNAVLVPDWSAELVELWPLVYKVANMLLAIDEAEDHIGPSPSRAAQQLVMKARNRQVSLICATRTPPLLWKKLRGTAEVTIAFRQEIEDYAEVVASECFKSARPDLARLIMALPKYSYLSYANDRLTRGATTPLHFEPVSGN